jgi:diguanylate cyclase (GGDEF)-like protein
MLDSSTFSQKSKNIHSERIQRFTFGRIIKRLFDIFTAGFGLIILSPLFLFVAVFLKRDSVGPVFFWCKRMGRWGRPFRMLKFRTMYEQERSYQGPPITCEDDDRITPMGQWLRDTKINELPQLWNVLIGEMSLVGPRPEDFDIGSGWPEDLKEVILSIRPGITSPASILYHDEEHLLSKANVMGEYLKDILPDKLRLDRLYVRNQSFSADLDIIFWTLIIIIPRMARTKIPEGLLFAGPISRLVNRYVNWFFIDLIISFAVVGLMGFLWRLQMPLNWGFDHLAMLAVILALFFSGVNSIVGLNRIVWSRATFDDGMSLTLSCASVTFVLLILNWFQTVFGWFSLPGLPITMLLSIGVIAQLGFSVARFRWRIITAFASRWLSWRRYAPGEGERVMIVGSGEGFQTATWLLRGDEFRYIFTIVGLVDDDIPTQLGMWVNGCLVLGGTADIPTLVEKYDVGVILFTMPRIATKTRDIVQNLCQNCDLRIAFIHPMLDLFNQQMTLPISALENPFELEDSLKHMALHDPITGLPNRFFLRNQLLHSLAYSRRYKTRSTVMFIQLQEFADFYYIYGPKINKEVLKQMTDRLRHFKRESDTLAYLGMGEFGLILENVPDDSVIPNIAKRIYCSISKPILVHDQRLIIRPSISVCMNLDDCRDHVGLNNREVEEYLTQRKEIVVSGVNDDGLEK